MGELLKKTEKSDTAAFEKIDGIVNKMLSLDMDSRPELDEIAGEVIEAEKMTKAGQKKLKK